MKRVTVIFVLLVMLGVVPSLAQDSVLYQDPAGRFSVPIPPGWIDESTAETGRFASSDGVVASILASEAADAASGEQSVLTAILPELAGTDPLQTTVLPTPGGTWTVSVYAPASDRLLVLATQWVNGVIYALLFDMPGQEVFAANEMQIVSMLSEFSVGERLDLTGVETQPLTGEMLADLEDYIEETRQRFHISGVSIAIVQNGAVIYTEGFGTTAPENGQPVTPETLFMIASVTKSMTTLMMGTLVDDGVFAWNQPVTDILPSFALSDPESTAEIRMRDLLNMSSGVSRYDIISNLVQFAPQELIRSLSEIPLLAAPGEMWNYSNQMVSTGGYLSALAIGTPMDALYEGYVTLMQERVFDPIGMPNTTFDFEAAIADQNHALPYFYDPVSQNFIPVPLDNERFTGPNAPAGAVWSNANDMGHYLQTELSGGVAPDGRRVISEATLNTTHTQEIIIGGSLGYGMGWFTDRYNQLPLVWHGGNTLGFTSDLAFLPRADLGVVIMTNAAEAGRFTQSVREYVFELAFGLERDASQHVSSPQAHEGVSVGAVDPETVVPYLGSYEHDVILEMRGDELWLVGAFLQTPLYATTEGDTYSSIGIYSALNIRFVTSDAQLRLEISYPENPMLTLDKVE